MNAEHFKDLIDRYKLYLEEFGLEKERYKWEAIRHFQQTFDIDAEDFTKNFKDAVSKAHNLVYQNSIGFIRKSAEYFPEDVREMFRVLYNDEVSLENRFEHFIEAAEKLLPKVVEKYGKKLNHQQDERTISYYLTMRFPDKYPLYKNETYKYLLSIMGDLDSKSAGEKYFHYLDITRELVPVVESDSELTKMVESLLTGDCYQGELKWVILQDILWVNMRFINQANYWLFQGNPDVFDLEQALQDNALSTWKINAHKSRITPGDKVILWASGSDGGCYALAEVVSEVYEDSVHEDEIQYYKNGYEEDNYDQVQLQITHNLAKQPITLSQIKSDPRLEDLKIGNQGTNFSATEKEYEALLEIAEKGGEDPRWTRLQSTVETIGSETAVRKFFKSLAYLIDELDLEFGLPNVYCGAVDYYLHVTIGGKYLVYVQRKKGQLEIAYHISRDQLQEFQAKYPNLKYSDGYKDPQSDTVFVKFDPEEITINDVLDATVEAGEGLKNKYTKSNYRKLFPEVNNPWIFIVANDDELLERLLNGERPEFTSTDMKENKLQYPLNTIFYGPPGTGKTYTTIKRAAEIVEGRIIDDYDEAKGIFNRHLGDEIEFITFHQNYSYEDFIQGLRPDTENSKELTFERSDGVFKKLADRALKNWKASEKPQTKKESFEKVFNEFIEPLVEGEVEEIEVKMRRVSFYITAVTEKSIEFRKASGGTAHTLSINTLKKMYEAESVMEIQGLSSYYSPLLDELLDRGKSPGETELSERKNYVLIIDEINRANISRVFGELITLIEPDKRHGREFHIPAKLPSGESFSVPENLYIIGTMNTADKSIALLDIALRRRFDFEAMYPKYEIDGEIVHHKEVLEKINERIIKLKGHDFQIGHSYFMKNHMTLEQRMNRKVIPLLLEYFMNDEDEVRGILEHAGLNIVEKSWPLRINGKK
jgi:predicted RNA-binding protein with PUA-like domain